MAKLESTVAKLENRNRRVEADKAWETSWLRRLAIAALTYLTVVFFLYYIVHVNPWFNALMPVIGYSLSTVTIQQLKNRWLERQRKDA